MTLEYPQSARQPLMLVNNQKSGHLGQGCGKTEYIKNPVGFFITFLESCRLCLNYVKNQAIVMEMKTFVCAE